MNVKERMKYNFELKLSNGKETVTVDVTVSHDVHKNEDGSITKTTKGMYNGKETCKNRI